MPTNNLTQFILFITPGFLAIALYRRKYPARKDSDFHLIAWSLVYGVLILAAVRFLDRAVLHGVLGSEACLQGSNAKVPPPINLRFPAALLFTGVIAAALSIAWREVAFRLSAKYSCLGWLAPDHLTIWAQVNKDSNQDWAVVFLNDGAIYIGQIKHWTFDPNAEHQDFLLSKAQRVNEDLKVIYEVTGRGVYLNTRDVLRIEFTR